MATTFVRSKTLRLAVVTAALTLATSNLGARQSPLAIITDDLTALLALSPTSAARVIVQGDVPRLLDVASQLGVPVVRVLDHFIVVQANAVQVTALQLDPDVRVLSTDLPVVSAMAVSDDAMVAERVREGSALYPAVDGSGIGVAVVDSGIAPHRALAGKIAAAVSFVEGDPTVTDTFGHGTHIAGIIAGDGRVASRVTREYRGGISPGAHLVNVRVLDAQGTGLTSGVIAGLDWILANRVRHRIRVVNVSLGHPATAPCSLDPLCWSVGRLVQAGLVVVVSAGNRGRTEAGQTNLGTITSPGTSPFAITVAALNTWSTVDRSDDTITTYSSRGPTPYEFLIKPDVAAPGNKIVSLEAANCNLART
jgi:serine protease AprX